MEAKIFLDFSSVVWDENHFKTDAELHHILANEVIIFIHAFESCNNLKFVARTELLQNVMTLFPYNITKRPDLFDFKKKTMMFLSNRFSDIVSYDISNKIIRSNPDFCYDYFAESLKIEVRYLIAEMHDCVDTHVFCTFRTRWDSLNKQNTSNDTCKKHSTIIHEKGKITVEDYYLKNIRNIFEHNPKHDRKKGKRQENGVSVYPLTCFDGLDSTIPQSLLDDAIQYGSDFYNYDDVNRTFVCFKSHLDNKYHGYDEDIKNVPQKIREEFHK
jgi:hypothetical protein